MIYLLLAIVSAKKVGMDFFLVGDYAWIPDMSPAYLTFDAMNQVKKNSTCTEGVCEDDIDAFITMGDNLYPVDPVAPTQDELDQMLNLF